MPTIYLLKVNNKNKEFFAYIRIYHECESGLEKSVPRIAIWHHQACQVMTTGDTEGRIFLSIGGIEFSPPPSMWGG